MILQRIYSAIQKHPIAFVAGTTLAGVGIGFLLSAEDALQRMLQHKDGFIALVNSSGTEAAQPSLSDVVDGLFHGGQVLGQPHPFPAQARLRPLTEYFDWKPILITAYVSFMSGAVAARRAVVGEAE